MKLLSRAGSSVLRVGVYNIGDKQVYDLIIDKPLDDDFFKQLYKQLVSSYSYFPLQIRDTNPILRLVPVNTTRKLGIRILLLVLTTLTIALTGYGLSEAFFSLINSAGLRVIGLNTLIYTVVFLGILGFHEYGHIMVSRRNGVVIEGPFFLPAPPIQLGFIGTLGAVITMKTLPPTRRELAELGIMGPLAGYLAGLVIGVIAVFLSPVISIDVVKKLMEEGRVSGIDFMPLTLALLILIRGIPEGYTLIMHPLLFVSFVVFIVTFLNLMPIGQLDGGHVVRAFLSAKTYERIGYVVIVLIISLGLFIDGQIGTYYLFLGTVLLLLKLILGLRPHPGPANQYSRDINYRYIVTYLLLVILTMPIPSM
ncbi:MAG: site-2 protease family protein [Thermoprotei archaeon]